MTDFEALLDTLGRHEVAFIVVGGAAAIAHGSSQLTQDLDIVYLRSPANLNRLAAALVEYKPYLRGAPPGLPFVWDAVTLARGSNFTLVTSLGDIDLFGEIPGGGAYEDLSPAAIELQVFRTRCLCLSLPQLIRAKRASDGPRTWRHWRSWKSSRRSPCDRQYVTRSKYLLIAELRDRFAAPPPYSTVPRPSNTIRPMSDIPAVPRDNRVARPENPPAPRRRARYANDTLSRTSAASCKYVDLYGRNWFNTLTSVKYAESTSLNTCAWVASFKPLRVADIDFGPQFLALVAIEDAQRNVDADPEVKYQRRIAAYVQTECRIGGSIGYRQLVIGLGFIHRLHGGAQIGPLGQSDIVELIERRQVIFEIEAAGHVELLDGRARVEQHQHGDLRGAQINQRGFVILLVLHTLQMDALQIHLRDIASPYNAPG